jgi:uncharacterized protein (TIGR02147 family)
MNLTMDLAKLLKEALEERCQRNPKYSLRAFARDLQVPAPRLSRWLKGQEGLSRNSATLLAARLGLSPNEAETFVLNMESKYSRAKAMRVAATEKLKTVASAYTPLDVQAFKVIADWYHLATLSLAETKDFQPKPEWVAKRLGISVYQAQGAVERLLELEMLEQDEQGNLTPTGAFFANPTGAPSKSVRSFHSQILEKAKTALEFQTTDERDFSTLLLAVNPAQMDEAKIFIQKFREEFGARFCKPDTDKREVYALAMQFFKISENSTAKNSGEKT